MAKNGFNAHNWSPGVPTLYAFFFKSTRINPRVHDDNHISVLYTTLV